MNREGFLEWFGSEEACLQLQADIKAAQEMRAAGYTDKSLAADGEKLPFHLSIDGPNAVVTIRGGLTNGPDWYGEYGIATYNNIRAAVVFATNHPDVSNIVLDIDSGGGAVSGVNHAVDALALASKVKNTVAFTDGGMYSAAYWLGSQAKKIYSGKMAGLGSIGIISVHMDYSEALKKDGIKATVFRSGKEKALAHPLEPLSEKAAKQIQDRMDAVYKVFVDDALVKGRGMTTENAANAANGREFFGPEAVTAGLSDGIKTFDQVLAMLDKQNNANNNRGTTTRGLDKVTRAKFSPETLAAAAAAGVQLEATTDAPAGGDAPASTPAAAAEAPAAADKPADAPEASADKSADKPAAPAAATPAEQPNAVSVLTDLLNAANAALVTSKAAEQALQKELGDLKAVVEPMQTIVRNSIKAMAVPLGSGNGADADALSGTALVARHAALADTFVKKFPVGRVSATTEANDDKPAAGLSDVEREALARVAATAQNKK